MISLWFLIFTDMEFNVFNLSLNQLTKYLLKVDCEERRRTHILLNTNMKIQSSYLTVSVECHYFCECFLVTLALMTLNQLVSKLNPIFLALFRLSVGGRLHVSFISLIILCTVYYGRNLPEDVFGDSAVSFLV